MLEYLQKDPVSHIDMLEPLRRGTAEILYDGEDGVMILETRSQIYMISMEQEETCFQILKHYPPAVYAVHQKNIASALQEQYHFPEFHPCYQYCYPYEILHGEQLAKAGITEKEISQVRLLDERYLEIVIRYYDAMDDPAYIRELMERGQLWGIFEKEDLAGFIGEHLEGSMGLLEVLPEYRRKGYGTVLEAFLIRRMLSQERTPFCQVFEGNVVSEKLQQKLGLERSKQMTWWLF